MKQISQLWGSGRLGKLVVTGGVLIALFVVCGVLGQLSGTGSTRQTPTAQVANVEATATKPAPNTAVSATITPSVSAEVKAYALKAALLADKYAEGMSNLSVQNELASKNPALMVDETWIMRTAAALYQLSEAGKGFGEIEPVPDQVKHIDEIMDRISDETALLVDDYTTGLDNLDAKLIERAAARIDKVTEWTRQATLEMQKIISPGS